MSTLFGALRPSLRASLVPALCALIGCSDAPPAEAPRSTPPDESRAEQPTRLALWVLCEGSQRVLEHPDRVPALLEAARALGATDLFVQVYRGGRAWFDSSHADALPYELALAAQGADPLAGLIERAHADGLRVHAWVNALSLASNRDAPVLAALGRDAVSVDRHGVSILDYPKLALPPPEGEYFEMGTRAVWLDPAAPGVADWIGAAFGELAENYPGLDGIHLDYIRYPDVLPFIPGSRFRVGLDFGYGEASRARFEGETGLRAPFRDSRGNANAWDQWRRDRLTDVVDAVRSEALDANPRLALSAAVWAYPDRAYLSLYQDWRGWLDDGLLEFAVPMLYTRDDRLLRYEVHGYAGGIGGDRLWIGLGAWLFARTPERAVSQLRMVRSAGVVGQALFSYDAIADAPALRDALVAEARVER